jgi:hypothetical protein
MNLTHYTRTLHCTCEHGKKCDLSVLVATRIMGVFWGSGLRVGVWLQSWFSLVMLQNHSLIVYSESIHIRVGFGVGASG